MATAPRGKSTQRPIGSRLDELSAEHGAARAELLWLREEVVRSLVSPRDFARTLGREQYGIASLLVALIAGFLFSLGIDIAVVAYRDIGLLRAGLERALLQAVLMGATFAALTAVLGGMAAALAARFRTERHDLDGSLAAIGFGSAAMVLMPLPILLVVAIPALLIPGMILFALAVARILYGLALNLRGALPVAVVIPTMLAVLLVGWILLDDHVPRATFAVAAATAEELGAPEPKGARVSMLLFDVTLPDGWENVTIATDPRFQAPHADIVILTRGRLDPFTTLDTFADRTVEQQTSGSGDLRRERAVVRIAGDVAVDDRYSAVRDGRRTYWRQFAMLSGAEPFVVVYRAVDPPDPEAAMEEAASIAGSIRIKPAR